ncbi:hypothetical protein [Sedimentibacter sp.]|uniref:ABC transporter permease n=1 Tax=Sedimentibacter sp. TaxID=1960295 RepID=UPI00289F6B32|nr:hypothetical protein [Sedimentibacter sp.]
MKQFTGTGKLLRLYIRRDWLLLPIWLFLPVVLVSGQMTFVKAMPDWRLFIEELSESAITSAWLGPIYPLSLEGAILWRGMLQAAIVVLFGAAFTVIRHTRTEEMSGRSELILGKPVGRYANVTAAVTLSCAGSLLAGLLCSASLFSSGFAAGGSLIAGLTIAASGCVFAGLGSVLAQFFGHSGQVRGAIFGVYGLMMLFMVLNNVNGGYSAWAWLNPGAWFRVTAPFAENHIWPLFIFAGLALIMPGLSYALLNKRDMGAGIIAERERTKIADIKSPIALAWHSHKRAVVVWSAGLSFIGVFIGAITPSISMDTMGEMLAQLSGWGPAMMKLGNQEGFIALSVYILGLMGGLSVFALTFVQSMRGEENEGYTEILLSKPVSRLKWMGSYLAVAFAGSSIILLAFGIMSGLGWSIGSGNSEHLFRVTAMSISKIPSVWIIIGIAALLYGWLPRIASFLGWLIWGVFVLIEMLWEAGIVGWSAMKWTPFSYAHYSIPINEISMISLIVLVLISGAFTALGIIGFKRRNII